MAATIQLKEDYKMAIFLPALPVVTKLIGGAAARRIGMKGLQTLAKRAKNQKDFINLAKNKNKKLLASEKIEKATAATRAANKAKSAKKTDAFLARQSLKKGLAVSGAGGAGAAAVASAVAKDDKARREKRKKEREAAKQRRREKADFYNTRQGSTKADPIQIMSARKYTIKSGDTLSQVARNFGVSLQALKKANKIENVNKIRAGQKIIVPGTLKDKATNVYRGTDTSKISMGRTDKEVQEQKEKNKKTDKAFKSQRADELGYRLNRKKGGKLRGMGVALRGGGKVMKT